MSKSYSKVHHGIVKVASAHGRVTLRVCISRHSLAQNLLDECC